MDPKELASVYKYLDVADRFVRIRVCDARKAGIRARPDLDRAQYRREVVQRCVEGFDRDLERQLCELDPRSPENAADLLYQLVVTVNPDLDIRSVGLRSEPGTQTATQPAPGDRCEYDALLRRRVRGLEQRLGARIFGQEEAVRTVARVVRRAAAGLSGGRGPIASLLFAGSTGTGKTELARALADELDPVGARLVRIDCGEFGLGHETAKLVGAPPGYVGFEDGGVLTEALRRCPRAVVVFDEIEKAHARMRDVLLALLEEGEITDGKGRQSRLDQAFVILTSNVGGRGAPERMPPIGFGDTRPAEVPLHDVVHGALAETFPPEFLGRIDATIVFRELDRGDARRIARARLTDLAQRVRQGGRRLRWTEAVAGWVASAGFSAASGAREIERIVRREIEAPLVDLILDGDPGPGEWMLVSIRDKRPHIRIERR